MKMGIQLTLELALILFAMYGKRVLDADGYPTDYVITTLWTDEDGYAIPIKVKEKENYGYFD